MNTIKHIERNWQIHEPVPIPQVFRNLNEYNDLILQTLIRRGYTTPHSVQNFIDYTSYSPASPYEMPDMQKGVQRIINAIQRKEKIGIWGDFDVDGQTSTAILKYALQELDASHSYHIPVRGPESHGIGINALKDFLSSGVEVILTCDTGISAYESIAYAQSLGIDVIVTDHHLLPESLPPAYALINPQRLPAEHALATLPGAGTAYKFAEALLQHFGKDDLVTQLHDLAALGIVADLAELLGDARYLVQSGLARLRVSPRPALSALLEAAEVDPANLTEEQISFVLAPRLNAVGRLADANPMVDFLLSNDRSEIAVRVNQIEGLNDKRKLLCDQVFSGAQSLIDQNPSVLDHAVLVLYHADWPAGVVGIVASRLVELYHHPVILLCGPTDQPIRGSARSVEGIDITGALRRNENLLAGFGGHPMAAGLSLNVEKLPALIRGLDKVFSETEQKLVDAGNLWIDHILAPSQATMDIARSLDLLAPYGPGNPPLVFMADHMRLIDTKTVGKLREHLLVDVEDINGNTSRFVWWNGNALPIPEGIFDLAYTLRASNYRGEDQVSFEWLDYRIVSEQIDFQATNNIPKYQNIDLRDAPDPLYEVQKIKLEKDALVWMEGTTDVELEGVDRFALHPARELILYTVPAGLGLMRQIFSKVKPEIIYWCLFTPPQHQLDRFLRQLAKQVKNMVSTGQYELRPDLLAAQNALNTTTIELALRWIAARGMITITSQDSGKVFIKPGGTINIDEQKYLEKALTLAFNELNAFTRYLKQVDLDQLLNDLRQ